MRTHDKVVNETAKDMCAPEASVTDLRGVAEFLQTVLDYIRAQDYASGMYDTQVSLVEVPTDRGVQCQSMSINVRNVESA